MKIEFSARYLVIGAYRDRNTNTWRIYPLPGIRITPNDTPTRTCTCKSPTPTQRGPRHDPDCPMLLIRSLAEANEFVYSRPAVKKDEK